MQGLPKLKDLAYDGNPFCENYEAVNFELICRNPKLKMLNDSTIKELDRDVAQQWLEMHGIVLDLKPALKGAELQQKVERECLQESQENLAPKKKTVSFKPMNQTEKEDYEQAVNDDLLAQT